MSQVEVKVNYILGIILLIQVVTCLAGGIAYGFIRN